MIKKKTASSTNNIRNINNNDYREDNEIMLCVNSIGNRGGGGGGRDRQTDTDRQTDKDRR